MGAIASRWSGTRDVRVLMVGLDAAGKTTILYKLKLGEIITTIPTIGFNVETLSSGNLNFTVWDVGSRDKVRALWRHYYQNSNAVIYVIDSNDRDRLDEAVSECVRVISADELKDAVLLVLCNKQDLPNAMSLGVIRERLQNPVEGPKIPSTTTWAVMESCATSGAGLHEALAWLETALDQRLKTAAEPVPELVRKKESAKEAAEYKLRAPTGLAKMLQNLSAANDLDDAAFQETLQGSHALGKQPSDWFTHGALIRIIRLKLKAVEDRSKGRSEAVNAIFEDVGRWYRSLYRDIHITHTYFWIQLTDLALHIPPQNTTPYVPSPEDPSYMTELKAFLHAYPFLLNGELVNEFYSAASVFAPMAQSQFVLPDRQPLPSVLNFRSMTATTAVGGAE